MGRGKRYDAEPKLNIKKIIIVLLAIAVIFMFVVSLKSLLNKDLTKDTQKLSYFTILENDKWGVINSKGEIVVSPAYEEMIIIPDETQALFFCTYNVKTETNTYQTKVINEKEELLFTDYDTATPIDNIKESGNLTFEKQIFRVQKDGKYGLANKKGQEILKCEYDSIISMQNITNSLLLTKDGLYGLASSTGDLIIAPSYQKIEALGKNYSEGYIVINTENKYGIIDSNKKTVLEPKYEEIKKIHGNDCYVVKEAGSWKIIDKKGEKIADYTYEDISQIMSDTMIIKKNGKWGSVALDGTEKIKPQYEELKFAYGEHFIAKKDNLFGMVNNQGEEVLPFEYISLQYRKDADFVQAEKVETETLLLDKELQVKITGILSEVNIEKGYIRVRVGDEYKYYNFKFEEKKPKDVLTESSLFLSIKNGKYGFVDKDNNIVVPFNYDDATEQNSYGYAAIKKDGKWGSVNKEGKIILEPSIQLDNNLIINFIEKWHLAEELNMNYYCK